MPGRGQRLCAALALLLCGTLCQAAPDFAGQQASDDARYAANWVLASADNEGRPFAIVDKIDARIYVFEPTGRLIGASATLLGLTPGDLSVPDINHRTPASLTPDERTTPAGRFPSQPGHNDKGEAIVWVDYDASVAIHRLRQAPPQERRPERLDSPTSADNRISLGCIIVPVAFYESVVGPSLGRQRGVVYVLPESRPVYSMFGAAQVSLRTR
jgi:hypothetical protein